MAFWNFITKSQFGYFPAKFTISPREKNIKINLEKIASVSDLKVEQILVTERKKQQRH